MERRVPARGTTVTAIDFVDNARGYARLLEEDAAQRSGVPIEDARPIVAGRLGIAPGTLTSLRKNRLKDISAAVYDRLNKAAAQLIERQIANLEHELDVVRRQGLDGDPDRYATALEALVARAKKDVGRSPVAASDDGGA